MIEVRFPPHLRNLISVPECISAKGNTVAEVLQEVAKQYPQFVGYVLHEDGSLRQHVHIFLGQELIEDRQTLSDSVTDHQSLFIMQALSGG